ncbi:DUF547 domain-containing protein [candidate division KSB1 bacterium]|nr:DUF547 domain-containing protein [candidate division KSB1 bacterium]
MLLQVLGSAYAFDHSYVGWSAVLSNHVHQGQVQYGELAKDRALLDGFVAEADRVPYAEFERWTRSERLAFVLNLYNAAVIQLVLNHWPLTSVKDLGFFTSPWNVEFIPLFGHTVSLGNLEHDVLRPSFKDPRTHFAICNAAVGSPRLRGDPYLPEHVDAQLDDQVRAFMTERPDCNRFADGTLTLSPIFDWYSMDFGKRAGILTFVRTYFPGAPPEPRLEYTEFDWSLNGE